MTEACKKICDAESDAEREVICQALFGKAFSECLCTLRREDFADGVGSGRYVILRMRQSAPAEPGPETVEVDFTCVERDRRVAMLYDTMPAVAGMPGENGWVILEPYTYQVTLPTEDAPRVAEEIRKL